MADEARTIINNWVSNNTFGLIRDLISDDVDMSDWQLVALNTIYFKGIFLRPFPSYKTSKQAFYTDILRENTNTDCYLMHLIEYYGYYEDRTYHVALALPKISITMQYELQDILPGMGMVDAFDENLADFSGITDNDKLVIDKVIHQTTIEMDEYGLVATAVTVVSARAGSGPVTQPIPVLFKADHPFQMFIIDSAHDHLVLFQEYIANPGISIDYHGAAPIYDERKDDVWSVDGAY